MRTMHACLVLCTRRHTRRRSPARAHHDCPPPHQKLRAFPLRRPPPAAAAAGRSASRSSPCRSGRASAPSRPRPTRTARPTSGPATSTSSAEFTAEYIPPPPRPPAPLAQLTHPTYPTDTTALGRAGVRGRGAACRSSGPGELGPAGCGSGPAERRRGPGKGRGRRPGSRAGPEAPAQIFRFASPLCRLRRPPGAAPAAPRVETAGPADPWPIAARGGGGGGGP